MFGEIAYKQIHIISEKNNWNDGSPEKNALHALIGGIMSELGGSDFISGASGAMVNEIVQNKLKETFEDNPTMHQWASALIGGIVSEIIDNNAQAGASSAVSGTHNNAYGVRPTYEGAIIFVPGLGFFQVQDGKDVYMNSMPPEGTYIWVQDAENPSYGWDYQKGVNGEPDRYEPQFVLWSKYINIDDKAYGITFLDNTNGMKKIMLKKLGDMYSKAVVISKYNSPQINDIWEYAQNPNEHTKSNFEDLIKGILSEHFGNIKKAIQKEY